jgi:hypothetical protein
VTHDPPTLNSRTVFTLKPPCLTALHDCRRVAAMTVCRARTASRFTIAQLKEDSFLTPVIPIFPAPIEKFLS